MPDSTGKSVHHACQNIDQEALRARLDTGDLRLRELATTGPLASFNLVCYNVAALRIPKPVTRQEMA